MNDQTNLDKFSSNKFVDLLKESHVDLVLMGTIVAQILLENSPKN